MEEIESRETLEEMIEKVLKLFATSLRSYPEIDSFTQLVDLLNGTMEFRLRLSRRSGAPPSGDSAGKENKFVRESES